MATFQDHLDNMKATAVISANKALDYLDGDQIGWLKELLNSEKGGIKEWEKRGVYPWITNLTLKIVSRSALSYNEPPMRQVMVSDVLNEDATETYQDILADGDFDNVMDSADSVCRLLKNVIILAQAVEVVDEDEKILFSVLHRGNCDVDYDHQNGTIRSLLYQSAGASSSGNKLYHYWDSEKVVDIEIGDSGPTAGTPEKHGYGIIPAAILWDTHKPRAGFWPKNSWDELIRLNEGVNLYHTEVKFNQRFQAFPALFTNATIPEGRVVGPDAVVEISAPTGETVYLEYKAATAVSVSLSSFDKWLEGFIEGIADNWGVKLTVGGGGTANSGFQLVVEEVWNLTTRTGRLKAAESFEERMYKVILAISGARDFGLPKDSSVDINFAEPALPVNRIEDWTIIKEKIALSYLSLEDAWRIEDPDITPETIAERKALLGIGAGVPDFGGIVDGET